MLHSGLEIWPAFSFTIDFRDLPAVLAVGVVLTAAQVILSRREKRWPGLILPALWLLWTLAGIIPQAVLLIGDGYGWFQGIMGPGLTALAIENIPNLILLAIYAVCCVLRRHREKKQLKKIRIDDL